MTTDHARGLLFTCVVIHNNIHAVFCYNLANKSSAVAEMGDRLATIGMG